MRMDRQGRVDDLVQAMGLTGISKSQVSKLCKDIDERVNAFLERQLSRLAETRRRLGCWLIFA